MEEITKITKMYMNPSHGKNICNRLIRSYAENGQDLLAIEKDYLLGTGITFRLFFKQSKYIPRREVVYSYGRLKAIDDPFFDGKKIDMVLSMKLHWFAIGYFYVVSNS